MSEQRDEKTQPEVDWPCDFPTPHPPHEASAYDDLGILIGYTEHCRGGMTSSRAESGAFDHEHAVCAGGDDA